MERHQMGFYLKLIINRKVCIFYAMLCQIFTDGQTNCGYTHRKNMSVHTAMLQYIRSMDRLIPSAHWLMVYERC